MQFGQFARIAQNYAVRLSEKHKEANQTSLLRAFSPANNHFLPASTCFETCVRSLGIFRVATFLHFDLARLHFTFAPR